MKEQQKKQIKERYEQSLQNGERFWPDSIFKDLLVAFGIFILLILLATFVGVPGEPKADPNDTAYIPRPEWYFLFLFQMLKYFPGSIEWVGTAIIPFIAIGVLFLLPFLDKNPYRYYAKRKVALAAMGATVFGIVALTIMAVVSTPPMDEVEVASSVSEQIVLGQDLYSVYCAECHAPEGEGGEVVGVEGYEGVILEPLNSPDVMYTYNDESLALVIAYGQQVSDPGMPGFGRAYGGELSPGELDYLVAFMRYTWDDRAELPADAAAAAAIPPLGPDEVPSYDVHIQALVKRYCFSCHRPGKDNNNYLMTSYEEILTTGDNVDFNIIAGDLNSYSILVINGNEILDEATGDVLIHQMPPSKLMKPEYIDALTRWIMAGMPRTAEEAAALAPTATQPPAATPTP
ncbi:MAG: c-type cytochrome [Chloroflexota bacterium]